MGNLHAPGQVVVRAEAVPVKRSYGTGVYQVGGTGEDENHEHSPREGQLYGGTAMPLWPVQQA